MNEEKMIEVLARVEDEREAYGKGDRTAVGFDMASWVKHIQYPFCGTTACLAGHAAMHDGWELMSNEYCRNITTGLAGEIENVGGDVLELEPEEYGVFYLETLGGVYEWVAEKMGVDEQVLRDKVQAGRRGHRALG